MSTSKVFHYLIHMKIINVQHYQLMKINTKYILRGNTESSNYLANVKTIKRCKDRGKKLLNQQTNGKNWGHRQ